MHYKDGTEAKIGDIVRNEKDWQGYPIQGVVTHLIPGSESCNATVWHAAINQAQQGALRFPVLAQAICTCSKLELVYRPLL